MLNTQYYDNTHLKINKKCGCIVCGKVTDRLDVVAESYLCSPECEGIFYSMVVAEEMANTL